MTPMPNVIAFCPRPTHAGLRRPRILIRAAREGQAGWRRQRDLARLLHSDRCPAPGAALPRLRAEEAMLNDARIEGAADYDLQRHVLMLIAILAEMRAAVAAAPQSPASLKTRMAAIPAPPAATRGSVISGRGTAIPAHP